MKKKIFILLACMTILFLVVWVARANSGAARIRADHSEDKTAGAWWDSDVRTTPLAEWVLDPEIPDNYIPVPGKDETYMVLNEDGTVAETRQRTKEADGSWTWRTLEDEEPAFIPVEGSDDLYVDASTGETVKYVRNDDNSFAFVAVDENGNTASPEGSEIPNNYIRATGNTYAIYDEHGVITGYKERKVDGDGSYYWIDCDKPVITQAATQSQTTQSGITNESPSLTYNTLPAVTESTLASGEKTKTQTYTETKTENGWTVTYQTTVTSVYDSDGNLVSTKKEGPVEVSRTQGVQVGGTPDPSKMSSTLSGEAARVRQGLTYENDIIREVEELINAERTSAGLSAISFGDSTLGSIATAKAADMAIYDHSSRTSPMYGTITDLATTYGVTLANAQETAWKTQPKTANEINTFFMTQDSSRNARLSSSITRGAVSIVENNGYFYIYECYAS